MKIAASVLGFVLVILQNSDAMVHEYLHNGFTGGSSPSGGGPLKKKKRIEGEEKRWLDFGF